ncbi:hypothetical protein JIN77_04915 [Verrucomicrobiaceae bacterium R5-34]|nr:hypothetical protein [Verrucomicrobiaceae bacterium R5-34]
MILRSISLLRSRTVVALFGFFAVIGFGQAAEKKPLKVFVLVGQSNMQGHARVTTLEHLAMDAKSVPMLKSIQNDDGSARVFEDVRMAYLSSKGLKTGPLTTGFGGDETKIGPELTFGITMREKLAEPILIIKAAWGGKSLNTDFRPPSAGPYVLNETQLEKFQKQGKDLAKLKAEKQKATGHYYRLTLQHVKTVLADISKVYPDYDADQGYQLSGLVWFQGWNDLVANDVYPNRSKAGGYDEYTDLLQHLIRDFRKDLAAPKLPVVIGVLGVGGPTEKYGPEQKRHQAMHQHFRDAMAAAAKGAEFKGNVTAVLTENYWDMELDALSKRDAKLGREVKKIQKEKKLNGKEVKALKQTMREKEFTARELESLKKGISNGGYHYLGSAKILGGIGQGFAEAMLEMVE